MKKIDIVFCLPGRTYSNVWLDCWNRTLQRLHREGLSWAACNSHAPIVAVARNQVLGGSSPIWGGQLDYERMVWLDSDMVWEPEDLLALIAHRVDIVSGCYLMSNNRQYTLQSLEGAWIDRDTMSQLFESGVSPDLLAVSAAGLGFCSVRRGVVERMSFPWFQTPTIEVGGMSTIQGEDAYFFSRARSLGYTAWADPCIQVGHEKSMMLRGDLDAGGLLPGEDR